MCHSIRRLNDMAPFSIFNNYRDRAYERDLDKWTQSRLAQDKFFIIISKLKILKKIPQGYAVDDFAKFIGDLLFSSVVMLLNWELALLAADNDPSQLNGDAPRHTDLILNAANELFETLCGEAKAKFISEMIQVESYDMAGLKQENSSPKLLMIKIHEKDVIKYISEFQVKKLDNPLVSPIVKTVFQDYDFIPSQITKEVLNIANIVPKCTRETRQNNIVFNFLNTATKIYLEDSKKGCRTYDILRESFDCVIKFGAVTSSPENVLCAPLLNYLE